VGRAAGGVRARRALGALVDLNNTPKIFMTARKEWELNHHLVDEAVVPTDHIARLRFVC